MLRIRLSRTGKTNQESFRLVVAPHTNAVKGQYTELLGHYYPSKQPKLVDLKKDRIEYWVSVGAKPSSSVATLLKKNGMANMEQFIVKRAETKYPKKKEAAKAAA